MLSDLLASIDKTLDEHGHRVLIRARELVGDCTYAFRLPLYVSAKTRLAHMERQFDFGTLTEEQFYQRRQAFLDLMVTHHREMYRQPCLICPSCQMRKKLWQTAPFSLFGSPLTQRSKAQAQQSSSASTITT